YFMPLRAEEEAGRGGAGHPAPPLPPPESFEGTPPPRADWGRKVTANRPTFLPAPAVLGWLQGYGFALRTPPRRRRCFGVGDPVRGRVCWLGQGEWRVQGEAGYGLGDALWRTWLEAGGPWPTEFRLLIPLDDRGDSGRPPAVGLRYRRRGAIHEQL